MRVIAFDLGTKFGFCVLETYQKGEPRILELGSHRLRGNSKVESTGTMLLEYEEEVRRLFRQYSWMEDRVLVGYENVERHLGTYAAQLYGAFRGVLLMEAARLQIESLPVSVQAAKMRATGKGAATKRQMTEAATRVLGYKPPDDDAADALFIALVTLEQATGGLSDAKARSRNT